MLGNHPLRCARCVKLHAKCNSSCRFRKHFPREDADDYDAVSTVFGSERIFENVLVSVHNDDMTVAVNSLKQEAWLRLQDPVLGSYGVIEGLRARVLSLELENQEHIARVHALERENQQLNQRMEQLQGAGSKKKKKKKKKKLNVFLLKLWRIAWGRRRRRGAN